MTARLDFLSIEGDSIYTVKSLHVRPALCLQYFPWSILVPLTTPASMITAETVDEDCSQPEGIVIP